MEFSEKQWMATRKKKTSKKAKKPGKIRGFDWKDKLVISKSRICPPHRIPHKLPFGKKIDFEVCHIHRTKRGMAHHRPFCRIIKCQHYSYMVCEYKKYKDAKKELKKILNSKMPVKAGKKTNK